MKLFEALRALLPYIAFFWVVSNIGKVTDAAEKITAGLTKGTVQPLVNAWIEISAIVIVLGLGVWIVEAKLAPKLGDAPPGAPPVQSIGAAPPPGLTAQSGFGVRGGPVVYESGVGAASGQAPRSYGRAAAPAAPSRRGREARARSGGGGFGRTRGRCA